MARNIGEIDAVPAAGLYRYVTSWVGRARPGEPPSANPLPPPPTIAPADGRGRL